MDLSRVSVPCGWGLRPRTHHRIHPQINPSKWVSADRSYGVYMPADLFPRIYLPWDGFQQIEYLLTCRTYPSAGVHPNGWIAGLYRLTGSIRPKGSPACVVMIRRMRGIPYMTASPCHNRGDGATRHRQRISARISIHRMKIRRNPREDLSAETARGTVFADKSPLGWIPADRIFADMHNISICWNPSQRMDPLVCTDSPNPSVRRDPPHAS